MEIRPELQGRDELEFYEKKLKAISGEGNVCRNSKDCIEEKTLRNYFMAHKGKFIKAEIYTEGSRCVKAGKLLEVGIDYILLKTNGNLITTAIPINQILSASISHANGTKIRC